MTTFIPGSQQPPKAVVDAEVNRLLAQGTQAMQAGQFEAAGRTAEVATRIDPTRREPWAMLCAALEQLGSIDTEKAIAKAIQHFPEGDPFRTALEAQRAEALIHHAMVAEGVAQARIAASRPSIEPMVHQMLGAAFCKVGLFEEALLHSELAATDMPGDANALYNLATVYRFLGRFGDAEATYLRSLDATPDESMTFVYAALSTLRKWTADNNHIDDLRAGAARVQAGSEGAARIYYALFKELGDVGRYDEAWEALESASQIMQARGEFNAEEKMSRTEGVIATFPKARIAKPRPLAAPSAPRPIFIVGLPRSGTTLVERIFAAHSGVTAMGETTSMSRAIKAVAGTPGRDVLDPATLKASSEADPARIARLYQQYNAFLSQGADVVTDKLPHNYDYVGHIRLAFPDASIVHLRRSPMDSLFGAYRLQFGEGAFKWSYSLAGLAANYRIYRRLTDHWRQALGEDFIEITLETLIEHPDREIRRLIQACDLPFEEACLSPEKADGGVSTASSAQVRSPINSQGVGAWRRYARQLEPLRAELERDGFVDANGDAVWN
jgi:Flp pilus assembly protein TadD